MVVRVVALGLPGTCVTMVLGLTCIVPPHSGHSLLAGMTFVLCTQTLAPACRLDKPVIGSYR
jgi:hypothetical protein